MSRRRCCSWCFWTCCAEARHGPASAFGSGGKITLKGTCVSKKGRKVAVQGAGSYTPTSFNLTAEIATEFLGLDIAGKASTEARRIADVCPPPEPKPEDAN